MKVYLIITCLTFLLRFCGEKESSFTSDSGNSILGTWMIVNMNGVNCNACPDIIFEKSNKGFVVKPSQEKYDFEYSILEDELSISFLKVISLFEKESKFICSFETDNELTFLVLRDGIGESNYTLSRVSATQ